MSKKVSAYTCTTLTDCLSSGLPS